ncbi:MAG: hypothetical protein HY960_06460 [Ignavibacteriae bacterium]|nr:hypothetical protein [Ignavibacteriota bacterium]
MTVEKQRNLFVSLSVPKQTYTVRNGLFSNAITKLYQDSRGFLWIGTLEGVSVFDGKLFRHYTTLDGLASPSVNDIHESRTHPGTMWIATNGGGVSKFEGDSFTTLKIGTGKWSNRVNNLREDHQGRIWCLADSGVFYIEHDSVKSFDALPFVFDNFYSLEHGDTELWLANREGVFIYNEKTGKVTTTGISVDVGTWAFHQARNGDFWVVTRDSGFLQYRDGVLFKRHPLILSGYVIMVEDRHGYFWAGTTSGLYKLSNEHDSLRIVAQYTINNGLPENILQTGLIDRENCLWFGTLHEGFFRWMDGITEIPFPLLDIKTNMKAVKDKNDHLWMGTADGLLEVWRDDNQQPHSHLHRLNHRNKVQSTLLVLDSTGHLWVMVDTQEIHEYSIIPDDGHPSQLKKLKILVKGKELPAGTIYPFMVDRKSHLWYNTDKGIEAFNPHRSVPRIRSITQSDGLPDHSIWSLLEDSKGGYWFGGYIGGLSKFTFEPGEEHQIKSIHRYSEFPDKSVRVLFEDSRGRIWIGTRYGGVAIHDGEQLITLTRQNGLPSEWVYSFAEDFHGDIWIGTNSGLVSIENPSEGIIKTHHDFSGFPIQSLGVLNDETIWLVSNDKLIFYDVYHRAETPMPPSISFTALEVNHHSMTIEETMEFPYEQNNFMIEYVGLSFAGTPNLLYQHKLEPVDRDWSSLSDRSSVHLLSLQPGTYRFLVRAVNNADMKSENPAVFNFTILSPYWSTWWFYSLVTGGLIILIFGTIFLLIRFHHKKIKREQQVQQAFTRMLMQSQEADRKRIAAEMHDGLGQDLMVISSKTQIALKSAEPEKLLKRIKEISETASQAINNMREIAFNLSPYQIEKLGITLSLQSMVNKISSSSSIAFNSDLENIDTVLCKENEIHLYRIVQECLNNIVKHSAATTATVRLKSFPERIELCIHDDGKGFDYSNVVENGKGDTGLGLRNLSERVKLLNAEMSISSNNGLGTQIRIIIPIHTS